VGDQHNSAVRRFRLRAGLTQEELAERSGVSTRTIRGLETGDRRNPQLAFVIGGWVNGDERTVQYEGVADEPRTDELARIKAAYFAMWPDGPSREVWPGIVYVRVRPTWIRYSDFNQDPPVIVEFDQQQLGSS